MFECSLYLFRDMYTVFVHNTRIPIMSIHRLVSLSYSVYLTNVKITEPEAESDTHASFESGFRNNSIVQNNNYSFYHNYQNTPSSLAPLYNLCFWTSTIVVVFIQHLETLERRSVSPWPPLLVNTYSTSTATCSRCPPPSAHNVVKSCGLSPMRATNILLGYMFATPSFIQNLHVA